jgi:hypothetical protein
MDRRRVEHWRGYREGHKGVRRQESVFDRYVLVAACRAVSS